MVIKADTCVPTYASNASMLNGDDFDPYSYSEATDCPDSVGADVSLAIYVVYFLSMNLLFVNLLIAIYK